MCRTRVLNQVKSNKNFKDLIWIIKSCIMTSFMRQSKLFSTKISNTQFSTNIGSFDDIGTRKLLVKNSEIG